MGEDLRLDQDDPLAHRFRYHCFEYLLEGRQVLGRCFGKEIDEFLGYFLRSVGEMQVDEICKHFVFDLFLLREDQNSNVWQ